MDFPILGEFGLPWLGPVQHVVIDLPWLPSHPTYPPGTPFTLPGGNPDISEVATSQSMHQKTITHGGTTLSRRVHGRRHLHRQGTQLRRHRLRNPRPLNR
ncbi:MULTISPECIES: hypothetical protein [Rhodococcus]|uniref:hypothetical protein n=1 Tax=Rhodococcus TaxID=1827 RepID=UPI001ED92D50|nr:MULTISPECIES: hypothetical protein [Rhodococcus]